MAITYPKSKRYPFHFRHEDAGLAPVFTMLKRLDTLTTLGTLTPTYAPVDLGGDAVAIVEIGNGWYYFDWVFQSATDPDVIFEVDGGDSIPTEEVRYLSDGLSVQNLFLDEPISQVASDVWDDAGTQAGGTKGSEVNMIAAIKNETDKIGDHSDSSSATSLFGVLYAQVDTLSTGIGTIEADLSALPAPDNAGIAAIKVETDKLGDHSDSAGSATLFGQIYGSRNSVMGADSRSLTDVAGAGFTGADDSLVAQSARLLRSLGMLHENSVMDLCSFDANNNLTAARLRLYTNATDATAAKAASPSTYDTNKVAQYSVSATYQGTNLVTYTVLRES